MTNVMRTMAPAFFFLIVGLFVWLGSAGSTSLHAQEVHRLRWGVEKGDSIRQKAVMKFVAMDRVEEGLDTQARSKVMGTDIAEWEFTDEVRAVSKGLPISVTRRFSRWITESTKGMDGEKTSSVNPLQGKIVILEIRDGETVRKGPDGLEPKALQKAVLNYNPLIGTLPSDPVSVGHVWKLRKGDLFDRLKELAKKGEENITTLEARGKFVSVMERRGTRCALLRNDVRASGPVQGRPNWIWVYSYRIETFLTLDGGRPLTTTFKIVFSQSGPNEREGRNVQAGFQTVMLAEIHNEFGE